MNNGSYSQSGPPHPVHFICRETGELVPLVAVDELPSHINLCGVPRQLAGIHETVGMMNLGRFTKASTYYVVEGPAVDGSRPVSNKSPGPGPSGHVGTALQAPPPPFHQICPPINTPENIAETHVGPMKVTVEDKRQLPLMLTRPSSTPSLRLSQTSAPVLREALLLPARWLQKRRTALIGFSMVNAPLPTRAKAVSSNTRCRKIPRQWLQSA